MNEPTRDIMTMMIMHLTQEQAGAIQARKYCPKNYVALWVMAIPSCTPAIAKTGTCDEYLTGTRPSTRWCHVMEEAIAWKEYLREALNIYAIDTLATKKVTQWGQLITVTVNNATRNSIIGSSAVAETGKHYYEQPRRGTGTWPFSKYEQRALHSHWVLRENFYQHLNCQYD